MSKPKIDPAGVPRMYDGASMPNAQRTPWLPGNVKPARDGVYERESVHGKVKNYVFVDGSWRFRSRHGHGALVVSGYQSLPWRGLAEEPKA